MPAFALRAVINVDWNLRSSAWSVHPCERRRLGMDLEAVASFPLAGDGGFHWWVLFCFWSGYWAVRRLSIGAASVFDVPLGASEFCVDWQLVALADGLIPATARGANPRCRRRTKRCSERRPFALLCGFGRHGWPPSLILAFLTISPLKYSATQLTASDRLLKHRTRYPRACARSMNAHCSGVGEPPTRLSSM